MSIKMKVKVTKEILEKSKYCGVPIPGVITPSVSSSCAVSLAVRDIFPTAVISTTDLFPFDTGCAPIPLPGKATNMIYLFDSYVNTPERRLDMEELEFEIEVSDDIISKIGSGNIEETKKIIANSKTLELI